ncbi:EVE domain-containing protein [Mucilaginibacter sp.]|uniref:EVE domain-containing protein n=1 Tax=Mucilaginibacter sp. TaxID=1882438 RepID=UPI003266306C
MKAETQYWITVVSKDHLQRGVSGGFMQANHGKEGPLKRLHEGDWVVFYSPKLSYSGKEPLQAFTAIGRVCEGVIYQHKMAEDFTPYRRNVEFYEADETPIAPLIDGLEFIENKKAWGFKFRFGFFEIGELDFKLIRSAMITGELTPTTKL